MVTAGICFPKNSAFILITRFSLYYYRNIILLKPSEYLRTTPRK
nr:MAG TPA: hypothetical protein [Caudoviricetes sp.]